MYYKRSCLTERSGCVCIGPASRYVPCNTQTCVYPAQRTCCIPYVPMIITGKSQCGPLPREPVPTANSQCCPKDGIWSEWTGYTSVSNGWARTRECTSEEAGCPCTGISNQSQEGCPCPEMRTAADVANICKVSKYIGNESKRNETRCEITAILKDNNDDPPAACANYDEGYQFYKYAPVVTLLKSTNECYRDTPLDCESRKEPRAAATRTIQFSCNLETRQWYYEYDGTPVIGFVQHQLP
ncbi:hypothetical protein CAEBREN_05031 [Caenorhabditis brenneri]|uniref:Uncharacterized protein n=1 Tax=Caenorhabditis brenneri TaxID=135651 RepID=G0N9Z9_CAEBE|nr:hypothetical protein CAEBREN_05031 [Caenorhabditis brenneri]